MTLVRVPGFEPGFPRWQRGVITATLHSRSSQETNMVFLSVGIVCFEYYKASHNQV